MYTGQKIDDSKAANRGKAGVKGDRVFVVVEFLVTTVKSRATLLPEPSLYNEEAK